MATTQEVNVVAVSLPTSPDEGQYALADTALEDASSILDLLALRLGSLAGRVEPTYWYAELTEPLTPAHIGALYEAVSSFTLTYEEIGRSLDTLRAVLSPLADVRSAGRLNGLDIARMTRSA